MSTSDILLGLIAVLFPPIAVWIKRGICSLDSLLNIVLLVLGYIPGLLHAWYIIARYPDSEYEAVPSDSEIAGGQQGERVVYYYVSAPGTHGYGTNGGMRVQSQPKPSPQPGQQQQAPAPSPQGNTPNPGEVGSSAGGGVPPSYAEAIQGDNKLQK